MKVDERILVEALKRGEEKAFRHLYDHHYVVLCKMANGFLHDSFWAETIVDDTFFHLWEIRENLEITTSLRSYLVQAVRNRCLNQLAQEMDKQEMSFSELPLETLDASLIFRQIRLIRLVFCWKKNWSRKSVRPLMKCRKSHGSYSRKVALN